jgi:hypothetical protein
MAQPSLIMKHARLRSRLLPLVEQRQHLAEGLARLVGQFGLGRRTPEPVDLREYLSRRTRRTPIQPHALGMCLWRTPRPTRFRISESHPRERTAWALRPVRAVNRLTGTPPFGAAPGHTHRPLPSPAATHPGNWSRVVRRPAPRPSLRQIPPRTRCRRQTLDRARASRAPSGPREIVCQPPGETAEKRALCRGHAYREVVGRA